MQAVMQEVLAALCDPTRRAALALLWNGGEPCVCELMTRLNASQSRMSRHMKVLREAGLVLDRRDAQWVRYRRNPDLAPDFAAVVDAILAAKLSKPSRTAGMTAIPASPAPRQLPTTGSARKRGKAA